MHTITISDPRDVAAIERQTAAYNAGLPTGAPQLSVEEYLLTVLPLPDWRERWAPESIPTGTWLQRWTPEERKAARTLGTQNAQVQAWLDELDAHESVTLSHDSVQQGVPAVCAALEQLGVIAAGQASVRAAAILAY